MFVFPIKISPLHSLSPDVWVTTSFEWIYHDFLRFRLWWNYAVLFLSLVINFLMLATWKAPLSMADLPENITSLPAELFEWVISWSIHGILCSYRNQFVRLLVLFQHKPWIDRCRFLQQLPHHPWDQSQFHLSPHPRQLFPVQPSQIPKCQRKLCQIEVSHALWFLDYVIAMSHLTDLPVISGELCLVKRRMMKRMT